MRQREGCMIVGIPRNDQVSKNPAAVRLGPLSSLREALLIRGGRRYVPV
jgi:hypothetical protein